MRVCHRCGRLEGKAASTFCVGCGLGLTPHPRPWRDSLSSERVEHDFLATLRTTPADTATRLVYADWLEARGDAARAEFVRYEGRPANPRPVGDLDWRAIVSRAPIGSCRNVARCPGRWDLLESDPCDEHVRSCRSCGEKVTFCNTKEWSGPFSKAPVVLDMSG